MQMTYAAYEPLLFWLREEAWRPLIRAPCRDKNGAGSGICLVYLWGISTSEFHSIDLNYNKVLIKKVVGKQVFGKSF